MQREHDSAGKSSSHAAPGSHPIYSLIVRQQPERARLCSYKEENETMDRRPVDPPPVVEFQSNDENPDRIFESTSFFIRATTVSSHPVPAPIPDHGLPSIMMPVYAPVKTPTGADATTGEVVQTPEKLRLLDGSVTALCIFAKLSVRVPGVFRLMFTLYETSEMGIVQLAHTVSEPFEVFSPKLFKGMHESTPLTRHLAAQGLKIKLRTDTSVGRQSTSRRRGDASARRIEKRTSSSSSLASPVHSLSPVTTSTMRQQQQGQGERWTEGDRSQAMGSLHTQSEPALNQFAPPRVGSSSRSLVWRHSDDAYSHNRAGPGPSTSRKRPFADDGTGPSYTDLVSRYDWTPTPPATDLSAFSLSRPSTNSHIDPSRLMVNPNSTSTSTSHRSSTSSSSTASQAHRNLSPFPNASGSGSGPSSFRTNTSRTTSRSSYSTTTTTTTTSSSLPLPFQHMQLGTGDDGIPILPLPSMYTPSGSGFTPPSVSQVLGSPKSTMTMSNPISNSSGDSRGRSENRSDTGGLGQDKNSAQTSRISSSPLTLPPFRPRSPDRG